jgi:phosphoribosylformylglycinamidine cyclo-ligase
MPHDATTYESAGVNIDEAQRALRAATSLIQSTHTGDVVSGIGGFGGVFRAAFEGYERPMLVSSIDGVGTKTKLAAMMGQFRGLGEDIVNHCVNDILCLGAKPLFFLDYFGTSVLSGLVLEEVLGGMVEACCQAGCALLGGETAEMPDVYHDEEVDIVGTIVGVVEADKKLPRSKMQPGDAVVGIASNGLHTNGYSLARKALFEIGGLSVRDEMSELGTTIGEELLRPHKSYLQSVYPLLQETTAIHSIAHITGGGFYDNLPRVMPTDVQAVLEKRSWTVPPIFQLIQQTANIPDNEMYRTFNMGIGMVLFVEREAGPAIVQRLIQSGEMAAVIGSLQPGSHDVQMI